MEETFSSFLADWVEQDRGLRKAVAKTVRSYLSSDANFPKAISKNKDNRQDKLDFLASRINMHVKERGRLATSKDGSNPQITINLIDSWARQSDEKLSKPPKESSEIIALKILFYFKHFYNENGIPSKTYYETCINYLEEPGKISKNRKERIGKHNFSDCEKNHINASKVEITLTSLQSANEIHFSNNYIDVMGRDDERLLLYEFLEGDGFSWLQIAGGGGQGKSRLAHDLVLHMREEKEWHAGFLEKEYLKEFLQDSRLWLPENPTLIVFDYVLGLEKTIGTILHNLLQRKHSYEFPVRVILLERQPWVSQFGIDLLKKGSYPGISQKADWFLRICAEGHTALELDLKRSRFSNGLIELKNLTPDTLVKITRDIAKRDGYEIKLDDNNIKKHLHRLDRTGSPLYAYFFSRSITAGRFQSTWKRSDLLTDELVRTQKKRWQAHLKEDCPAVGSANLSMFVAVLATALEKLSSSDIERWELTPLITNELLRKATVLSDGSLGTTALVSQEISGLQPDILGEWFVLFSLSSGLQSHLNEFLLLAWTAPRRFSTFMYRCTQDFPLHPIISKIMDHYPDGKSARKAYDKLAVHVYAMQRVAGVDKLNPYIFRALQKNAKAGNTAAMGAIGSIYLDGKHVRKSKLRAYWWFRKAAKRGDHNLMYILACFFELELPVRIGFQSRYWIKAAAKAGNVNAMLKLGQIYQYGAGVEQDHKKAIDLYRQAAALGNAEALAHVGLCYSLGHGVSKDLKRAKYFLEVARLAGYDIIDKSKFKNDKDQKHN